jgi:hypothetical protein
VPTLSTLSLKFLKNRSLLSWNTRSSSPLAIAAGQVHQVLLVVVLAPGVGSGVTAEGQARPGQARPGAGGRRACVASRSFQREGRQARRASPSRRRSQFLQQRSPTACARPGQQRSPPSVRELLTVAV